MTAGLTPNARLAVNMPFQHGKSWLCSHYFPAWLLLLYPETRIVLASYEERYSGTFGAKVRDVLARFGAEAGITLRPDSKARNEWVIEEHGGGMVCKGRHGALTGRPADLLLLDDTIKDAEEALSRTILDGVWDWFQTVAYSRLGPTAPIIAVGTRWCKRDLFGRIFEEAKDTNEPWRVVRFPAIAEENDPLGRKPGEALWPARVPLARLELIRKKRGRWFGPCWQQKGEDEEGVYFHPQSWPRCTDLGDAYSILPPGKARSVVRKDYILKFVTVDWAWSEKKTADYSAIGVFGLTPDGYLLILDVVNRRLRPQELAPEIAAVCKRWRPSLVAIESGHPTLRGDCEARSDIPPVRWLTTEGKSKLMRSLPAISACEQGKVCLPDPPAPWQTDYTSQMSGFTGLEDDHDDMVDVTSYGCQLAGSLKGHLNQQAAWDDEPLVRGREVF